MLLLDINKLNSALERVSICLVIGEQNIEAEQTSVIHSLSIHIIRNEKRPHSLSVMDLKSKLCSQDSQLNTIYTLQGRSYANFEIINGKFCVKEHTIKFYLLSTHTCIRHTK